jgi:hypothetical protein
MSKYRLLPGKDRDQGWSALILVMAFAIAASALTLWPASVKAQQEAGGATPNSVKSEVKGSSDAQQLPIAKGGFLLRVGNEELIPTIKLVAKEARVTAIAAKLSSELKVQVKLGPAISKQKFTVDLNGLTLEAVLRYLAPQSYVDYVAGGYDMGHPKALAIYLYGLNDTPPSANETANNRNQSLFTQGDTGDTEEGTEEYERREKKEPLEVAFSDNRLSVRAEKQPLSTVLTRIAKELGIPCDVGSDTTELVSVNFKGYPIDQAMRFLSPSIQFYYRADLTNFENQLTRVVLKPPSKSTSKW